MKRQRCLTQDQLDRVWALIEHRPKWTQSQIADAMGVHRQSIATIIKTGRKKVFAGRSVKNGLWASNPSLRPKHATAEQFSAEWFRQCDQAFSKAMRSLMEAAE